ncbi:TetR-like C-terminal domain-containing protein, partial [Nocardia farcinica]|uniref:TetR-like C-terminal domain-containing protein n=1 Tax=Nocardia farcinica TaxID=37329 RepID=UPI002453E201
MTTVYRRWPTTGAFIIYGLLDAFAPLPLVGAHGAYILRGAILCIAGKIAEPGVGDAFAGVFSDAVSDPELRTLLSTRFQDPYRIAVQDALGESEQRVLFYIDVVVGTLLHRMGMTGAPMVESDVEALIEMTLRYFGTGDEGNGR